MAENETGAAVAEAYNITVEDVGPATKKVSVEIPADRIKSKLAESFKELRQKANIPGFRVGHAPAKLIEKRFGNDVKEDVRRALISESFEAAVEKNSLQVIGEPEFDNPEAIKLPDDGALNYTFSVEVQPDIPLPNLEGIEVKRPKIEVKDENVDQALQNLREQQGTLTPVEDRGVEAKDYLTADVHLKVDGNEVAHQHDTLIVARAGRIAGIQLDDLADKLAGAKAGETRSIDVTVPDTHPNETVRGKAGAIEVAIKDIKRLDLAEINQDFLTDLGFENEQQLRDALRDQMLERIQNDVQQSQRDQISQYLLANTQFELPAKLSDRQAERVVQRRAMTLAQRGVSVEQIKANLEQLKTGAKDEGSRELKLFFILQKIATEQNTDVEEPELNGRIAMMAAMRGERPEKVKQEMSKDGSLQTLYVQMREQKAIDKILEKAKIEEVEVVPEKKD